MFKTFIRLFYFFLAFNLFFLVLGIGKNQAQESATDSEQEFIIDDTPETAPSEEVQNKKTKQKKTTDSQEAQSQTSKDQVATLTKARPELGFGVGNMTQLFRKVQTNVGGSKNNFKFEPYLSLDLKYPLSPRFSLIPSFGLTIPHTSRDDNITKFTYYFLGEVGFHFYDFTLKGGGGLSMTFIKGKGGEERLSNGNGTTSFTVPSGTSTTRNLIMTLGAEYRFVSQWAGQLQTFIFNPHDSKSRAVTYTLSAVFYTALGE